ncbi:hypothetical protein Nepgr_016406 [Nepenthes gracilis]|uniref:Uncharacterized protein n=1 Tax=Nepenthes gracilis TaxID=150966 RepID=A0AAD3XSG6_NEPGR|nr:hypothetical protein Nepgr_016406 [Nepenthes gracilis]
MEAIWPRCCKVDLCWFCFDCLVDAILWIGCDVVRFGDAKDKRSKSCYHESLRTRPKAGLRLRSTSNVFHREKSSPQSSAKAEPRTRKLIPLHSAPDRHRPQAMLRHHSLDENRHAS